MGIKANASKINGRSKNFAQRLRFAYYGKPGVGRIGLDDRSLYFVYRVKA
jgi:hypothetical protein